MAKAADDHGYHYVGICDHVTLPESVVGGMGTYWADPISTLGWIAALTSRVGLLTHVFVLPYRHPLMAAKQFSTIDYLSAGRMICGIGAGHVEAEFGRLGIDFEGRGRAVADGVPVLIEALTNEFVDGFGARPRPVQSPARRCGSPARRRRRSSVPVDWPTAGCPRVRPTPRWSPSSRPRVRPPDGPSCR